MNPATVNAATKIASARQAFLGERANRDRSALHEQNITDAENGAAEFLQHVSAVSIQAQHLQSITLPKSNAPQGTANQPRARHDQRLDQGGFLRVEIGIGKRHIGTNFDAGGVLYFEHIFSRAFDEQHISALEFEFAAGQQVTLRLAQDPDHRQVKVTPEIGVRQRFPHER